MSNNSQNPKVTIIVAVISLISALGVALFTNWDKVFSSGTSTTNDDTTQSEQTSPSSPKTSTVGVAIVFDPPSNVRKTPNGDILCSVRERTTINIYSSHGDWQKTDICGSTGFIHSSQITFQSN
ncbi:MAG: hypothetical protein AB4063_21185 [Crocosphaera sp.]